MSAPQVLKQGSTEERAENARMSSFVGAIAIKDMIKTTLGPKGMDKILQSVSGSEAIVTNDGATILGKVAVDNAAAKLLIDVSKTQDIEVGDGTTSVTVLTGELLGEAEKLVDKKLHPQTIIQGYRIAYNAARDALVRSASPINQDPAALRTTLMEIARTTLSSKILAQDRDHFADIAVRAVLRLAGSPNLDQIHFIKKVGAGLHQSYLEEGFLLAKHPGVGQPTRIEKARIMIANTAMDTDKIKIYGATAKVENPAAIAELEKAEKEKMKEKVQNILSTGCNCFINRLLIYNYPEQLFTQAHVMAIEHAEFEGIERLALVTGAEIASNFGAAERVRLGQCDLIEEIMIGEDKVLRFAGLPLQGASTIVLRGANKHVLDEAERSMHDALCVLVQAVKDQRLVYGGGCSEMLMSRAVDEVATQTMGKKALAVEAFARALRSIPTILADNAGLDSQDLVARLRAAHYQGNVLAGLDLELGAVGDMRALGITETLRVKEQVLVSASEAAEMILRVDDIIQCAPRQRGEQPEDD
ncbi:putative T-complex protein 1 subunit beta [Paratrimastix pyriformis]|uniref:CCT-beta n=1 Tax=Paratrimastix pyriformis TaxID=342808 RepID=A0ABQ8UPV6_9EUKA|nr:putative T-complex protein 1 subunit beta [Paratrimastix pyriformis]